MNRKLLINKGTHNFKSTTAEIFEAIRVSLRLIEWRRSTQGGQPIQYTSRALTETEKRYSQIDKESIVYGLIRFHTFTRMAER